MAVLQIGKRLLGYTTKNPGKSISRAVDLATLGTGAAWLSGVPGLNKAWTQEAIEDKELEDYAKDPNTGKRDLSSVRDDLGWKNWIPGLRPTDAQIKSALEKKEQGQIAARRAEILAVNPQLARYLGGRVEGETSEDFETRSASAYEAYDEDAFEKRQERERQINKDRFHSDEARHERLVRERMFREDNNRFYQQQMNQMDMYRMGIEREDRRDRRDARMQLVAALTGSLGNLGDAFLSI